MPETHSPATSASSARCQFPECPYDRKARGWCHGHYSQWQRGEEVRPLRSYRRTGSCSFPGCDRPHSAKGWCATHYRQVVTEGRSPRPIRPRRVGKNQPGATCAFGGCEDALESRGYCAFHASLDRAGEPLRPRVRVKGGRPKPPKKKRRPIGARSTRPGGYIDVKTEFGWRPEHRHVMEQRLGRPLLPGENVHHKNGDRADNRPENLALWVTSQPAGQRVEDKVAFALEMLQRYAPDRLRDARRIEV